MDKIDDDRARSVAIVIPTFNRCEFLKIAIESALNQTLPCEVVVCDHGSTDDTPAMMKKFSDKVRYVRREDDFGPHFCWLEGILNTNCYYLHIQFDDDWIDNTYIERCVELMRDDVGVVIAEASGNFKFKEFFLTSGVFPMKKLDKLLLKGNMYSPGASLFRKQDLVDALYQGELPFSKHSAYHGVGPDSFFTFLVALRYKKVGIIVEHLVYFREHDNSITCNANNDPVKYVQIKNAYSDVTSYYMFLKWYWLFNKLRLFNFWYIGGMFTLFAGKTLKKIGLYDIVRRFMRNNKNK